MSFLEVFEEVRKDVTEELVLRTFLGEFDFAPKYMTWMKRNGQRNKLQIFKAKKVKSAKNNTYLFIPWCKGRGEQIEFNFFTVIYYKGYPYLMYVIVPTGELMCLPKHYFDRYAERKEGQAGKEITPEYMAEVAIKIGSHTPCPIPDTRYPDSIFAINDEGISLGNISLEDNYTTLNTFISFDMLRGTQQVLAEELEQIRKVQDEIEYNEKRFPNKNNDSLRDMIQEFAIKICGTTLVDYMKEIRQ